MTCQRKKMWKVIPMFHYFRTQPGSANRPLTVSADREGLLAINKYDRGGIYGLRLPQNRGRYVERFNYDVYQRAAPAAARGRMENPVSQVR